jgi:hypothetical protein
LGLPDAKKTGIKAVTTSKVTFFVKAIVPTNVIEESDITNSSLAGKFTMKKGDLP